MYQFLWDNIFSSFIIFVRLAAAFIFMPPFGDIQVSVRIRLLLSFTIALIISPLIDVQLLQNSPFILLIVQESFIGVLLGLIPRFFIQLFDVCAHIVSFQSSLSNAFVFNPSFASQGTVISSMLGMSIVMILIAFDFHHLLLISLIQSYKTLPLFSPIPWADITTHVIKVLTELFYISVQLSLPFLIGGTLFHFITGLLNRLMPQLQIFFISLPLQILLGLALLGLTSGIMLINYAEFLQQRASKFLIGG
ncbi:MAG: flagellar biosynthetic protein FliR [Proteobacteria bacterium]|nr:flagellar biosynthetic protein FliR [Pseudomonadota bacterium]